MFSARTHNEGGSVHTRRNRLKTRRFFSCDLGLDVKARSRERRGGCSCAGTSELDQ